MNLDETLREASVALGVQLNLAEDIVAGIEQAVNDCTNEYIALSNNIRTQMAGTNNPAIAIAATVSILCGLFDATAKWMLEDPKFDGLMRETAYLAFDIYLDKRIREWQPHIFNREAA